MSRLEVFLTVALVVSAVTNIAAGGLLSESGNDLKAAQADIEMLIEQMEVMAYICNMQLVPGQSA